jgi:hypothetical protein
MNRKFIVFVMYSDTAVLTNDLRKGGGRVQDRRKFSNICNVERGRGGRDWSRNAMQEDYKN